jgi:hypothetical protein
MTHRDDLYSLGMSKNGCTLGSPRPQPDPHHIRATFAWEVVTLVALIVGVIGLVLLAGRGGN